GGAAMLAVGAGIGWANRPAAPRDNPEVAELPTAPAPQAKGQAPAAAEAWPFARGLTAGSDDDFVGVAPDGRTLILRRSGGRVLSLDLTDNSPSLRIRSRSLDALYDAAVSPDGKYIATAEG